MNLPMLFKNTGAGHCEGRGTRSKQSASLVAIFSKVKLTIAIKTTLYFLLPIIFFQNCSYKKVTDPSPAINRVMIGEMFEINLPEAHSKGITWRLEDQNKPFIELMNSVWHGEEKGINFNFKYNKAITDTLKFTQFTYSDKSDYVEYIIKVE